MADRWEFAILLIVAERAGKAIGARVRDAMLSHAGSQIGLGFACDLHGALDQRRHSDDPAALIMRALFAACHSIVIVRTSIKMP
jgi:hypothetical protein